MIERVILSMAVDYYKALDAATHIDDYPSMRHYASVVMFPPLYAFLIVSLGTSVMAQRKAFNITKVMQWYNVAQILLNIYIFVGGINSYFLHPKHNWSCMNLDKNDDSQKTMDLRRYATLYCLSKVLDLTDSIFFLLRKQFEKITFLRMCHRLSMVPGAFMIMSNYYDSQLAIIGWLSSLVHVLIYSYYLLASQNTKINLEAWKPFLLQIQILQFALTTVGLVVPLMNNWCGLPYFLLWPLFLQNLIMAVYSIHLYRKNVRKTHVA